MLNSGDKYKPIRTQHIQREVKYYHSENYLIMNHHPMSNEELTVKVRFQEEEIKALRRELRQKNTLTISKSAGNLSHIGLTALFGGAIAGLIFLVIRPSLVDNAALLGALAGGTSAALRQREEKQ
jgi:hypothetical protein